MIASKGDSQMYKRREKSIGWAAFDQQQRQKDVEGWASDEPFPSLSGPMTVLERPKGVPGYRQLSVKPFSSVVVPSVDFLAPARDDGKNKQSEVGNYCDSNSDLVIRRLKEVYSWADDNLVGDIMAAADNDFNTASSFLKGMVSDNALEDHKCCDSVSNGTTLLKINEISVKSLEAISEPRKVRSSCPDDDSAVGKNNFTVHDEKFSDELIAINAMLGQLTCVPVEPEWEEDDVYLSCRKDAIKMMRSAARHSKAATSAFLRGDHYAAQQFSLKAQEEWESANRLNGKAAREILSIRNGSNGIWRLDLHGLHASEAVKALQERLHMIETQIYFKGSSSPGLSDGSMTRAEVLYASSSSGGKMEKPGKHDLCRPNLKWLEVITGIGNHSRGGAALPAAVRTFLIDNGYRMDEARPGVIMVRPKLRSK
ncbi:hypothetical protein RND81_04G214200 [Saponaria officinalis]|uniref:Smr domain-containing protein n=1 Tax=Saponaria officinalis TaxID=3572 RepID=A0AAW1LM01_SAPOF